MLKSNLTRATDLVRESPLIEDEPLNDTSSRDLKIIPRPRASFSDSKFAKGRMVGNAIGGAGGGHRMALARNLARQASQKHTRARMDQAHLAQQKQRQ